MAVGDTRSAEEPTAAHVSTARHMGPDAAGHHDRHPEFPGQDRPLLTPDDVHHKWFTTARLREGYDLGQVDSFLHDVEVTLDRLYRDNAALRGRLDQAPAQPAPADGEFAARVLALADRTAEQTLASACTEATRILSEAQERAARIEQEAAEAARRTGQEAVEAARRTGQEAVERGRAQVAAEAADLDRQLHARRSELAALNSSRLSLERQLAGLRGLVAEYRSGLTVTVADGLDAVDRRADAYLGAASPPPPGPFMSH
ncbi:DivIVA domain-containing protein [Streptomyces sp. NBC_01304]|uniref:DivIVA domain-containing protein n=1 Tax=Streptomyces sp. NBC_01304 TaxID=2903818 RepID=UPI002E0E07C1|nr:DivIVA domain-containing protein [Streptomyces sp. NBC_01304]